MSSLPRRLIRVGLLVCSWCAVVGASEVSQVGEGALRLKVDAADAGALLIEEAATTRAVVSGLAAGCWSLEIADQGKSRTVLPREAGRVQVERLAPSRPGVRLVWSDFAAIPGLRVEVVGELTTEAGVSRWQVAVDKPAALALAAVNFPRLRAPEQRGEETLAVAAWMGEVLARPRQALAGPSGNGQRLAWDYPGRLSLQCVALTATQGPGVYLACDDAAAFRKTFAVRTDGRGGLDFEVTHWPENAARGLARFAPDYGVRVGSLHGDWLTAAERYRGWARDQTWMKEARRARGVTPVRRWTPRCGFGIAADPRGYWALPPCSVASSDCPSACCGTGGTGARTTRGFPSTCHHAKAANCSARRSPPLSDKDCTRWCT
jgi:hypothetical protein